jgi:3-oxoadipate enol-lactonase
VSDLARDVVGTGPPVVLVHAALGGRRQWDDVVPLLTTDHRVVAYDVRGYGDSPDPTGDFFDHDDLLDLLDDLRIDRAVLVGASNGGRIVADTAVMAPDRVAGLVLLCPALPGVEWDEDSAARFEEQERLLEAGDVAAAAAIDIDLFLVGVGRDRSALAPGILDRLWPVFERSSEREHTAFRQGEPQELDPPLRDRLGDIAAPTRVVVGSHDQPRMHTAAGHYVAGIPRAAPLDVVPGAAHLPAVEAPEQVALLIREHLESLGW